MMSGIKSPYEYFSDNITLKQSFCLDGKSGFKRGRPTKEMNKLVLIPDSLTKLTWDMFANSVYLINIYISSGIIAFHMKAYDHFWR